MNKELLNNYSNKNKQSEKEDPKNPKNPTYDKTESQKKLMGGTGLGVLLGMGWSLTSLRKKLIDDWNKRKKIALRNGDPIPPKPPLTKGALLAMLKGAALGGAAGAAAGKLIPGFEDAGASLHGVMNKAMTGSILKTTPGKNKLFSELDDIQKQFVYEFFSDMNSLNLNFNDFLIYENFSKKEKTLVKKIQEKNKESKKKKEEKVESIKKTLKDNAKDFIDGNSYNKSDYKKIQSEKPVKRSLADPNADRLLPVLGLAGGATTKAYLAYRKALKEWKGKYDAALENDEIPPEKPKITDFVGEGVKGGLIGLGAGYALSKTDIGKKTSEAINPVATSLGLVSNRRKANKAIMRINDNTYKQQLDRGLDKANKTVHKSAENLGKVMAAIDKNTIKKAVEKSKSYIPQHKDNKDNWIDYLKHNPAIKGLMLKSGFKKSDIEGKNLSSEDVKDMWNEFISETGYTELKNPFNFSIDKSFIYNNSYITGFSNFDINNLENFGFKDSLKNILIKNKDILSKAASKTAEVTVKGTKAVAKGTVKGAKAVAKGTVKGAKAIKDTSEIYTGAIKDLKEEHDKKTFKKERDEALKQRKRNFIKHSEPLMSTKKYFKSLSSSFNKGYNGNFSDEIIDVENTNFSYVDYKNILNSYGVETLLTKEEFDNSYNTYEGKLNLIKNIMLKD